jgi:hypothetical protein
MGPLSLFLQYIVMLVECSKQCPEAHIAVVPNNSKKDMSVDLWKKGIGQVTPDTHPMQVDRYENRSNFVFT